MIYIISEKSDISTDKVISYLIGAEINFERINISSLVNLSFSISNDKVNISLSGRSISQKDIIWIRRGRLNFLPKDLTIIDKQIVNYLFKEENSLNKSLELYFKNEIRLIGSYLHEVENYKLTNLLIAKQVGFKVPDTLITNNKEELILFFNKHESIVSKALRYSSIFKYDDHVLNSIGTFKVSNEHINILDDIFAPIFLQEEIIKEIELRIFFFKDKMFSMAIFSQLNSESKLDYRNEKSKKNRCVPFELPNKIKIQIVEFMRLSCLDTGSLDIILTKDNEYYFLEVNPQGQFDWLSENCNYYIEKFIADQLS